MSRSRLRRDVDWAVGTSPNPDTQISRAWEANVTTFNNPSSVNLNRLGIIIVHNEDSGGGAQIDTITVGGLSPIEIVSPFFQLGFSNEYAAYYLTEAQLQVIGTNPTINITFTSTPDVFSIATVIYSNVNQSSPVVDTDIIQQAGNPASPSLSNTSETGSVNILGISSGTSFTPTVTTPGFFQVADISNSGGDAFVYEKIPSQVGTETANFSLSTSNRTVCFLFTLRK